MHVEFFFKHLFLGATAPLQPTSPEGLYICLYVCMYVCMYVLSPSLNSPPLPAVYYIGTMPRFVQIETWFFGIIVFSSALRNYLDTRRVSGYASHYQYKSTIKSTKRRSKSDNLLRDYRAIKKVFQVTSVIILNFSLEKY